MLAGTILAADACSRNTTARHCSQMSYRPPSEQARTGASGARVRSPTRALRGTREIDAGSRARRHRLSVGHPDAAVVHWEDMGRLPFPASSESPGRSATSWVTRAADQVSRAGRLRGYRQIHEARFCQRLGASFRCAWAPPSSRSYVMVSSLGRGQPPRDPHATMARGSDSMHPSCQRVTDVQARAHVALDARVLRE